MKRKETLDRAAAAVLSDRQTTYGTPEDNFGMIGKYWSIHLGREVNATDVAIMLGLLKMARLKTSPQHADNWVDMAGYAACGAEVAKARLPGDDVMPEEAGVPIADMDVYKEGVEIHMTPKMKHARHMRDEIVRKRVEGREAPDPLEPHETPKDTRPLTREEIDEFHKNLLP